MHSIDVTENWDDEFKSSHVSIILKTLYSIKLQYPEGIEIDIPRTFRSVYKFKFQIDSDTQVFPKHWEWLMDAIAKKSDYKIVFNHSNGESSLQVKDDTLIFTVWYSEGAEAYQYLPLEYHREDAIKMCQQIQAIYARHADDWKFHCREDEILAIPPNQFPLVRVIPFPPESADGVWIRIRYYSSHSYGNTFEVLTADRQAIRTWLETIQSNPEENTSFRSGHTELSNSTSGINVTTRQTFSWSFLTLPSLAIPQLIAALS